MWAKRASVEPTLRSQPRTRSNPAPIAGPLTAAIVTRSVVKHGRRQSLDRNPVALVDLLGSARKEPFRSAMSLTLPPAENAGPSPWMISTPTSGSSDASSMAPTNSSSMPSPVMALRVSGRARVRTAIRFSLLEPGVAALQPAHPKLAATRTNSRARAGVDRVEARCRRP